MKWYSASRSASVAVGADPAGLAFDGSNIWVANRGSNSVTKLRASDMTILGTYSVGREPCAIAFDGANVSVVNNRDNTLTQINVTTGSTTTVSVGAGPVAIVFNGVTILWPTRETTPCPR